MPENHQFIKDLVDKTEVSSIYRIANKQVRLNRNGDTYLQVDIYDKTGSITVRMWNAGDNVYKLFEVGDYAQFFGKTQVFQGNLQIIAKKMQHVSEDAYDPDNYIKQAGINVDKLLHRMKQLVETIKTPSLRNLADCFLIDNEFMTRFCDAPAGVKNHHAYKGGLLEHTLSIMELADKTAITLHPNFEIYNY